MRKALLLVVMLSAGCAGLQRPTAQVAGVSAAERTPHGVRVEFTVALENPNDTPLPIRETRYTVDLEQAGDFTFTDKTAATIPANGVQTLTLPAAFALPGEDGAVGRGYRITGTAVYEPPGELRRLLTESHIPLPSADFSASGTLGQ